MSCSVFLGDLQQENLVLLESQFREGEDDTLALVPAHDRRVVADPQRFDNALLLSRAFGRLAVRDDKAAIVHLEGDVRVVGDLHMEVDHVIVDVDTPHLDLHAVFPGVDSLYIRAVLAVDVPISIIGFGLNWDSSEILVPYPPASITAFKTLPP